ncbi:MAG: class I SAM-dependent methyltransferase [Bacteroidetes bacterium]|nr:class I SAM-dependent methyltransferase [Bacteroidota bacterium]
MEDIFEDIKCCVCGNSDHKQFKVKYTKDNFSVAECNTCSFLFIPPYFRKKISYENYKDESVANAVRQGNNWVKIERHKLRYKLIRKYKSSGKLFDLGAGWGHFMLTGQMLGYDVYGIEIAEQPYLYAKNDLKLPVDHIDFFKMDESKTFDIITMWDVLEHIDKADDVIEKCFKLNSKDGILVIQVPQIDSYIARKYKQDWKMMGLDHVNYFGKKTITRLLEKHGYRVETIKSSFEIKLFIMYTILPYLKRKKAKQEVSQAEANKQINAGERQAYFNKFTNKPMWKLKLYMLAHNLLYNTLSLFNIGEEMIVVARKVK